MKRLKILIYISIFALFAIAESYAQFDKLSFGKYGISSVSPQGLRSVKGFAWVDVTNAAKGLKVSNVKGVVYKNGKPFVNGTANNFSVPSGKKRCSINGSASLCEGVSLWSVLSLLSFDAKDFSVDVSMTVTTADGKSKSITKKKVPLSKLLK